jgi:hemin uptake protein HemP
MTQPVAAMSETSNPHRPLPPSGSQPSTNRTEPRHSSRTLFGESRKLWIDHEGRSYALYITRQGKLILTR